MATGITPSFSYGIIAVQMVVYGLGMVLTSAPATESIMGAVSARQAGVGAFDHGLSVGCVVAAAIALAGALLAAVFLPAQPPQAPEPEHDQAELPATANHGEDLVR